jgi:hypothetical protein
VAHVLGLISYPAAEAKVVVDRWNEQFASGRDMLWSPLSRLDVEGYWRHVPRHALGANKGKPPE